MNTCKKITETGFLAQNFNRKKNYNVFNKTNDVCRLNLQNMAKNQCLGKSKWPEITNVDALAIAIGTAHGVYKKTPTLRIDRLDEITAVSDVALVLHGGSGVPDDQIQDAITAGIRKINFGTDLCYSFLDKVFEVDRSIYAIDLFMSEPIKSVKAFAESKIKLLGADNRI